MKNPPDTVENSHSIGAREAIWGVGDSLLVGLSFYLGFLLTSLWSHSPETPYIAQGELVLMSLGAAFSYAYVFVFRRDSRHVSAQFGKKHFSIPFWNISYAYLLHLSILLLVKDAGFSSIRTSIGLGYLLGYLCILSNGILIPHLLPAASDREGKKKLILREIPKAEPSVPHRFAQVPTPADLRRVHDIINEELTARLRERDLMINADNEAKETKSTISVK
jgi:hypothetical protein